MKFTIGLNEAKKALESSSVILSADAKIQDVLKNSLIQADDKGLLIQGTDLEIAMISRQPIEMQEAGSVLVDTKKLSDIIRYSSGETLSFETVDNATSGQSISIRTITGKTQLLTRSTDDFPKIEDFDPEKPYISVPRVQFIQAIQKVIFSVCEDETRRSINGLKINDNCFISTDGKSISIYKSIIPFDLKNVLLPQRAIQALIRILKESSEEVFLFQDAKNFYYFKLGNTVFSIRKVTIDFPEERLLAICNKTKEENKAKFTFGRIGLISAIERVRLNAAQDSNAIYFGIDGTSSILKSKDSFGNFSIETLTNSAESEDASKAEAFFNWINLLDALKAMTAENVTLSFASKDQAKKPLFMGEESLSVVVLPIEMAFNQAEVK